MSGRVKNPGVKLAPAGITIRELIDVHLSVSINDALRAWEGATAPDEKRDARRDLREVRAWANEIARNAGIPSRARMVR